MHAFEHRAAPVTGGLRAQPPVATLPSHTFAPPTTTDSACRPRSGVNRTQKAKMPGYGYKVDPDYQGPKPPPPPRSAIGYPYLPHNPTLAELEACTHRMSTVRFRRSVGSRSDTDSEDIQLAIDGSRTGKDSAPDRHAASLPRQEQAHRSDESDEAYDEESSGPRTPYFPDNILGQEQATGSVRTEYAPSVLNRPFHHPNVVSSDEQDEELDCLSGLQNLERNSTSKLSVADRAVSYAMVEQILYTFNSLVLGFKFPLNPEFILPLGDEVFPRLAHTGRNKALLCQKHELEKLLDRLDSIESHGDSEIRKVRKEAVERVTQELEGLNRLQAMAWYNHLYEQRQRKA